MVAAERERDGCGGDDDDDNMLMDATLCVGLVAPGWRPGWKQRFVSNSGQRGRGVEGKSGGGGGCIPSHSRDGAKGLEARELDDSTEAEVEVAEQRVYRRGGGESPW
jgi:hypothetical protein